VLEIGTGSGFFTACLARLAASVVSLEQYEDFADAVRTRLHAANTRGVKIEVIDAVTEFKADEAFDVMVVTGAVHTLPQHWRGWIKPGGRIIAFVGDSPAQRAMMFTRAGDTWTEQVLFETDMPYLRHSETPLRFAL
jgi:protein-L-isoaspartate(D-aspartate) O-methyltransferase